MKKTKLIKKLEESQAIIGLLSATLVELTTSTHSLMVKFKELKDKKDKDFLAAFQTNDTLAGSCDLLTRSNDELVKKNDELQLIIQRKTAHVDQLSHTVREQSETIAEREATIARTAESRNRVEAKLVELQKRVTALTRGRGRVKSQSKSQS